MKLRMSSWLLWMLLGACSHTESARPKTASNSSAKIVDHSLRNPLVVEGKGSCEKPQFQAVDELRPGHGVSCARDAKIFAPRNAYWIEEVKSRGLLRTELSNGARKWLSDKAGDVQPSISPDGEWIVFVSRMKGSVEIRAVTRNGLRETLLTKERARDRSYPTISPDGLRLVWFEKAQNEEEWQVIQSELRLSDEGDLSIVRPRPYKVYFKDLPARAAWHPDGEHFVVSGRLEDEDHELYLMGPSGHDDLCVRRITKTPQEDLSPVSSDDGRYLAWIRERQILVAPFSFTNAPCDGSELGVEWGDVKLNGVDGR